MSQQSLKRKWTLCLLLCWGIMAVYAQSERLNEFTITEFYQDQQATTAMSEPYGDRDRSGSWYAIIKFMSADPTVKIDNLEAFTFNFGNMKHKTVLHGDELWIYVQKNARTVSINREGYAPIKKWDLKTTLKEGATYVMKITFEQLETYVKPSLKKQFLRIQLEPGLSGAVVTLKREGEEASSETSYTDATGSKAWNKEFGTYVYEIKAPNYNVSKGRVKLTTSDSTYVEKVKLIPNFGYLEVQDPGNASGAKVFVNNEEVGTVPYKSDTKWDCGTYELLLVKDLYKSYTETFTIEQGKTTVIRPEMESDFAETTLTVEGDAEIYVDGIRKGKGRWAGPLKAGTYQVECRKANHRPTFKKITVEVDVVSTIALDSPVPITGFLSVNSNPLGAQIKIDGKDYGIDGEKYGVTPKNIKNLLIGPHKVEVSMTNRKPEVREVNIVEGKEETLNVELSSTAKISFSSTPSGAGVLIDGTLEGSTPFTKEMASGTYDIRARYYGYRPFHRKMYIDVATPTVHFKMARQLMKKNTFYFSADGQFGALTAVGGTMGFYAGNVNIEAFYMKGFGKETVYWNSTGNDTEGAAHWAEEELEVKTVAGGKFGYGFILGTRFRVTPQIGCTYVGVSGNKETSVYALSGTVGVRLEAACTSHFGISLTPEYAFKLAEADGYKLLSSVLPSMKDWSEGFNCKVGVYFFF